MNGEKTTVPADKPEPRIGAVAGEISCRKRALLGSVLACPACGGNLEDLEAQYTCLCCSRSFPVIEGVPRFVSTVSDSERQVQRSFDVEHRRYQDSRHLHFGPQLVEWWLRDIKLPPDYFKGKLVLDAGCGSGRWTYAMASLGANVVAVDLTEGGVLVTGEATKALDRVAAVQASIFELPFRPETFDLVVSWGVLHHTPDTKAAFERVAPLVKPGGQLYVMVYERHNPVKFFVTDLLRRWLRRLPEARRYEVCRTLIIKNRFLYRLLAHLVICVPHPHIDDSLELSTLQLGLYDAYAPMFNHLHTYEEVTGWFIGYGFREVTLTRSVLFTCWWGRFLYGECGGSINLRGVRV